MSEFFQPNAQVIQQRWPALFERLMAEDSSALQAELVQGLGSTLSVNGIQLTKFCEAYSLRRVMLLHSATVAAPAPFPALYSTITFLVSPSHCT